MTNTECQKFKDLNYKILYGKTLILRVVFVSRGRVLKDYYVSEIEPLRLSLGFRQFAKSRVLFLSNFKLKDLIPW